MTLFLLCYNVLNNNVGYSRFPRKQVNPVLTGFSGISDPQTMFTLVVVIITVVLFVLRVCFGMFKRWGPHKVIVMKRSGTFILDR